AIEKPSDVKAVYTNSNAGSLLLTSYPNLQDYREKNEAFRSLAGYTPPIILTMTKGAGSEHPFAELVTRGYFETLGIRPLTGRFFLPEEQSTPGTHPVAVVSHGAWQQRL